MTSPPRAPADRPAGWRVGPGGEFRRRLAVTVAAIAALRVGYLMPLPGIDGAMLERSMATYGGPIEQILHGTSGAMARLSVLAMGLVPYLSAWLLVQLLAVVVPPLGRLRDQAEGRRAIERGCRLLTLLLAFGQGWALATALAGADGIVAVDAPAFVPVAALTLTGGTFVTIWLAGLISERGLGHGVGLILFVAIAMRLPSLGLASVELVRFGEEPAWMPFASLATLLGAIVAAVFIDGAERRLPLDPAAREQEADAVRRRAYLPVRLGAGGVTAAIVVATIVNIGPQLTDRVFQRGEDGALTIAATLAGLWLLMLVFAFFGLSREWRTPAHPTEAPAGAPGAETLRETEMRMGVALALVVATLALVPALLIGFRLLELFVGTGAMLILAFVGNDLVAKARGLRALPDY